MADSVLREKAKQFAKDIVFLCREIKSSHKEAVLVNQLLRSATSIGANLHEAQYAQSKNDFISKLEIAQKECYETEYWLELLFETGINQSILSKYEQGLVSPTSENLIILAKFYNTSVDFLLDLTDEQKPYPRK